MKTKTQVTTNIVIVTETSETSPTKYYVKYRTFELFGLLKMWWYVLYNAKGIGLMYRPFYSLESAQNYIKNELEPRYA